MEEFPAFEVSHIFREGNSGADWVANYSSEKHWMGTQVSALPGELWELIRVDAREVEYERV